VNITIKGKHSTILTDIETCKKWIFAIHLWTMRKRILNTLNHVIFPAKIQISKPIEVSVFMFDLRVINTSFVCEIDWYRKISSSMTEYEMCHSFAALTRQHTLYSGLAGWYVWYQSINIQI